MKIDTTQKGWLAKEMRKIIEDAPTKSDQIFRHYALSRAIEHQDKSELQRLIAAVASGKCVRRDHPKMEKCDIGNPASEEHHAMMNGPRIRQALGLENSETGKPVSENDPAKYYAEQLQQVAEAIGMPFAPGHAIVHKVREMVEAMRQTIRWSESTGQDGEGVRLLEQALPTGNITSVTSLT